MRLAFILGCAALAHALPRPQNSEAELATPAAATPTAEVAGASVPSTSAAVLFPNETSTWSHNGTAYFKYSLPDGVSPKSVSYVLDNDDASLLKKGNSKNEELAPYFTYEKMLPQPAGTGTYWIKWIPAYGDDPENVKPGTGYRMGVAFRLGDASQPLQFAWSPNFEIRADSPDVLPPEVSAYPANATKSDWISPNGPTKAVGSAPRLSPAVLGAGLGAVVAVVAGL